MNWEYSLLRDTGWFLDDVFGDFELLVSANNRRERHKDWERHLDEYVRLGRSINKKGIALIEEANHLKSELLSRRLSILDAKVNGYLTFLTLFGVIATIIEPQKWLDLSNLSGAPLSSWIHGHVTRRLLFLSPPLFFITVGFVMHIFNRATESVNFQRLIESLHDMNCEMSDGPVHNRFESWARSFLVIAIIAAFLLISCTIDLLVSFVSWLMFSIFLCFWASQFLYWGSKKIGKNGDDLVRGMTRAALYRTMMYRFAWVSICITMILFLGYFSGGNPRHQSETSTPFTMSTSLPPFKPGTAETNERLRLTLHDLGGALASTRKISRVVVVGRADRQELTYKGRRKYASNWGLAQQRAAYVEGALVELKVPPDKIIVTTAGPRYTTASESAELLEQDRMVTVLVSGEGTCPSFPIKEKELH